MLVGWITTGFTRGYAYLIAMRSQGKGGLIPINRDTLQLTEQCGRVKTRPTLYMLMLRKSMPPEKDRKRASEDAPYN